MAPQQELQNSSTVHLCILRLLFRTVPTHARLTDKATIQNYYSRKARGQNTVHKQWPITVQYPRKNHEVTICFRLTWQFTRSKSNLPSVIPAIFWRIQGSLLLYKASLASVFLRLTTADIDLPQTLYGRHLSPEYSLRQIFHIPYIYIYIYSLYSFLSYIFTYVQLFKASIFKIQQSFSNFQQISL